jgi:phosphoribosylformylglycinamidine cyclo-ligase
MAITYKNAGVDIKKADEFVSSIKGMVHKDSLCRLGAFASVLDAGYLKKYKHPVLVSSTDGVGTKLMIAQELGIHDTVGIDLVAMNVNDLICVGARPLLFLDYVACGKVKPKVLNSVVKGINEGMKQSDCKLLGGETAEMPGMYDEDEYDLAGFSVGVVDKHKIIDGRNMKPGDVVIGIASSGVHSNGYSLVRKLFKGNDVNKYAKMLIEPTRIYVKPIMALLKTPMAAAVVGIAHNTGGAFYNKLTKVVPDGLGLSLIKSSWKEPAIFGMIRQRSGLSERELHTTFNMGVGMIVVVRKNAAARVAVFLNKQGFASGVIGTVVRSPEKMQII